MWKEVEVERVTDKEVEIRIKRRFPYDKIISLLMNGDSVFLPIDRKAASYLRRQLERRIGELVEAYPAIYEGKEGYVFRFSMVKQLIEAMRYEEGENQKEDRRS